MSAATAPGESVDLGLADTNLLRTDAFIGGAWADTGAYFAVDDPATGEVVARVSRCGAAETDAAIAAATAAQPGWAARTARERAAVLRQWANLLLEHQADLGTILAAENGKPRAEAEGEVAYAASFLEWFAEEARRVDGAVLPAPWPGTRLVKRYSPLASVSTVSLTGLPEMSVPVRVTVTGVIPGSPGSSAPLLFTSWNTVPSNSVPSIKPASASRSTMDSPGPVPSVTATQVPVVETMV